MFPEIDIYWDRHQKELLQSINEPVQLAIDGQCDSPGHSATYCTVTAMDLNTEKILNFEIIDVKEVKNSQGKQIYVQRNGTHPVSTLGQSFYDVVLTSCADWV